ncbi:hypothetical protein QR680_001616 [Steinernema hermaphroditum]|uniref:Mediator of RNA polymerase II transcription subunit 10 n=1 Tax=Steinernema hermaphroditum TaxID=289476 RepID=A0AA39GZU3_9BILA|nr:hypothetical protein QR680_001614 [Steinernema hermaphroditum]KAK0396196.1 hypothetical protein QR680_001616 [Steinernema hermaphroditum]
MENNGGSQYTGASGSGGMNSNNSDFSQDRFTQLERTLEQFQENARHLGVIATEFTSKSQEPLNQKLHTLISGLQEIDAIKSQFADVKVPLELLEYLNSGKNPHIFTREMLLRTSDKNREVNGKIEVYTKFRANLLNELGQEVPEDIMKYLDIRHVKEGNRK